MNERILQIEELCAGYSRKTVLHNVDLQVGQGDVVALLGANGAGKTTLLRAISGLIRHQSGTVKIFGRNVAGWEPNRIVRLGVGHVPEGRQPFAQLTVSENLRLGAYTRSLRADLAPDLALVYDYFPILKERGSQKAGLLSGGEQQMLVIGRALMGRPRLLLLDEPSLGLSPLLVKTMFEAIRRINREQGLSILLVEQNAKLALEVSSFGYVIESGRVVLGRPSADLAELDQIKSLYLGQPKSAATSSGAERP